MLSDDLYCDNDRQPLVNIIYLNELVNNTLRHKKATNNSGRKTLYVIFSYIRCMNLQAGINLIKSELDSVQDVSLVKTLKELINASKIKKYEASLKPMTQDELIERTLKSEAEIKAGNFITIEDLEKESANW